MSVDKENFVRPQIGWSIHCHDSNKKKAQGKSKGKEKAPPIPSNPFDQIKNDDKQTIIGWAKKEKINITHLTDTKKMKFGTDASLRDESALRDAWYRHEEISGKELIRNYPAIDGDLGKFFVRRRMKFIGARLEKYFKTLPAEAYPEEMQTYIAQVIAGEAELTEELDQVYNVVAMPTQEVVL